MTDSQKLLMIERELNGSKASFNISRMALVSALDSYGRDGVQDRLIYAAEEYGVDHAMTTLQTSPSTLGVLRAVASQDLPAIRKALTAAYAANHQLDTLMAEREALLCAADPSRPKGFILGDREVVYAADAATLVDRGTGQRVQAVVERVDTRPDPEPRMEPRR